MANIFLFCSSLFSGWLHLLILEVYPFPESRFIMYLFGFLTSLWNHGTTSTRAKWIDRVTIGTIAVLDVIWIIDFDTFKRCVCFTLWLLAVSSYIIAKLTKQVEYHMMSHVLIAFCHVGCFLIK